MTTHAEFHAKRLAFRAELLRLKPAVQPQSYSIGALVAWENQWHAFEEKWREYFVFEIDLLSKQENADMAKLSDVKAQTAANTSAIESAKTLINGLAAQIEANKTDPVALQAIVDEMKTEDDSLAAAVTANTPAAPTT